MIVLDNIETRCRFFRQRLFGWWPHNSRAFAWRELSSMYELLIAELLLRRTNAPAAHSVYLEFLQNYPTTDSFSRARAKDLKQLVGRLGLHWRAQNVVELAQHLRVSSSGIPDTLEGLSELPG